ncbi:flavin reductase family protein [Altericroceibacterium endophyticum]|uniref:Flavin reductase n=1 Tax=Altericroceibacterium endophyticum TaxID=1808508 RepID=A0A6I4T339_9SPHN|nr:flavin reductase family protein [Altericroceibacterium endophyticum]MXO64591.1 flavin reductase [Altericroceibacterium endophyticum]
MSKDSPLIPSQPGRIVSHVTDMNENTDAILDAFHAAMRHVSSTVYAITTGHGGARHGIIATAVSSLSFDPPSLLVCINRSASLHEPLASVDTFCVNVLGLGNRDVADQFMLKQAGEERFAIGDWEEHHGVPVLANAQSSFVCKTAHSHEFGTHTIFIGELIAASHRDNATPLTYYDRRYIDISNAPDQPG